MKKLNVMTVSAVDPERYFHTAFTVYDDPSRDLRSSAGWTLRDAIEYYAFKYGVEKDAIRLARPFVPQEIHLRTYGKRI